LSEWSLVDVVVLLATSSEFIASIRIKDGHHHGWFQYLMQRKVWDAELHCVLLYELNQGYIVRKYGLKRYKKPFKEHNFVRLFPENNPSKVNSKPKTLKR